MIDLLDLSLRDIVPPNIAKDDNISALISAFDPELQDISRSALEPLIFARIDELPETVIDLLAVQLHVDFYDLAGTIDMKREAVKGSLLWHMHKGTEWAIHEALRMIDIKAEYVPWWKDNGKPYTFKLRAIISGDYYRTQGRDKLVSSIRRAVDESKAARSYMVGLETVFHFTDQVGLYTGVVKGTSGWVRFKHSRPEAPGGLDLFAGLVHVITGHQRLEVDAPRKLECPMFFAPVMIHNHDINLGCDLDIMQELLRQFEMRIFQHMDDVENRLFKLLEQHHQETNAKLEDMEDLLRWRGLDES